MIGKVQMTIVMVFFVSNMVYAGAGVEESSSNGGEGTDDLQGCIVISNMIYGGTGVEWSGSNVMYGWTCPDHNTNYEHVSHFWSYAQ